MTTTPGPDTAARERPLGELIGDITDDLTSLFRQEVALAKAEVRQEGKKVASGGARLAGAGAAGLVAAILLSFAVVYALAEVMHIGWAALIVGALWAIAAMALQASGRRILRTVAPLPETTETIKENAQWLQNPTR
jgi:hypothetical protein